MQGQVKTREELREYLGDKTEGYWAEGNPIFGGFSDEKLYLPTHGEVISFLRQNPVRAREGFGEGFDCDDYSFVLKGRASEYGCDILQLQHSMCLGIAWGLFSWIGNGKEYHCCNWVIEAGEQFWWIEPQDAQAETKFHPMEECIGGLTLMLA